jgi:hypothetical protein
MRALGIILTALVFLGGAAGCRKDKGKEANERCLPTCEQRAKELHCLRPQMCKEECEDLAKRTVCRAELDTFAACFMGMPSESWECDEQSKPAPKQTVCVQERNAVSACMEKVFTSPNPPKTL